MLKKQGKILFSFMVSQDVIRLFIQEYVASQRCSRKGPPEKSMCKVSLLLACYTIMDGWTPCWTYSLYSLWVLSANWVQSSFHIYCTRASDWLFWKSHSLVSDWSENILMMFFLSHPSQKWVCAAHWILVCLCCISCVKISTSVWEEFWQVYNKQTIYWYQDRFKYVCMVSFIIVNKVDWLID